MKTVSTLHSVFAALARTSRRTEKEDILRDNDSTELRMAIRFLLDPNITTGISRKKIGREVEYSILPAHSFTKLEDMYAYLAGHNSGSDYDVAVVQAFLAKVDEPDREFCKELLIKTLRCGVDIKTVNRVYGEGFIRDFEVMLAKKYFECPEYVKGKEFTLTQKLDGVRCMAFVGKEEVALFSRQGKKILGCKEIETELLSYGKECIFDGELLADTSGSTIEVYGETTSALMSDGEKFGLVYHVFDCVDEVPYTTRRNTLQKLLTDKPHVKLLPVLYSGDDVSQIKIHLDAARAKGQEGIMINLNSAPYRFGRTKDLLKVKVMQDVDLRIIGFEEGRGALAGTLGSIVVDYKGNPLGVGSGFSIDDRKFFWENQKALLGRVATIQYFEETVPKSGVPSLRFPVYLRLREVGKEPSYN